MPRTARWGAETNFNLFQHALKNISKNPRTVNICQSGGAGHGQGRKKLKKKIIKMGKWYAGLERSEETKTGSNRTATY